MNLKKSILIFLTVFVLSVVARQRPCGKSISSSKQIALKPSLVHTNVDEKHAQKIHIYKPSDCNRKWIKIAKLDLTASREHDFVAPKKTRRIKTDESGLPIEETPQRHHHHHNLHSNID